MARNELLIPEPRPGVLATGWAVEVIAPVVEQADWDELDDAEGRLRALASWLENLQSDTVEVEKALRMVEYRRGVLLGPRHPGREVPRVGQVADFSKQTASRWRKIADHWDRIVWPRIMEATSLQQVTQAAVLRLIASSENGKPESREAPPEKPSKVDQLRATREAQAEQAEAEHADELVKEYERVENENIRLHQTIDSLQKDDVTTELAKLHDRYARLEGRLQQEMTTRSEAEKEAKYAKGMLGKIRKALGVERDRDIIPALTDLLR